MVIAATPTRREHLTKALLPALAAESESEPPIEVVVSTSDTQLCGLLEADGAPMTRCVTHRGRVGAPLTPSERDFVKRIPGDSRSRFEWYWRETVDTAVALVTSDTAVEPAMTLFLEDDVVPTKAGRRSSVGSSRRTHRPWTAVPASLTSLCCTRRVWCK